MIDELHVQNVALIRDASIRPASGLTVLTGETGAGKSALLSSVKLLMGERADANAVREGASGLLVEGRVFTRDGDPDGFVVCRRVSADGRGRVTVNGRMTSVRELSQGVGATIDLCGQHEHQRLLQQGFHTKLIDSWAYGDVSESLESYVVSWRKAKKAAEELRHVRDVSRTAAERVDEAAFVMSRIEEVDPKEGELEELERVLPRAEHAETLIRSTSSARSALSGEDGAMDCISESLDELRSALRFDEALAHLADTLESALIDIEDVAAELRDYRDGIDFDPDRLGEMHSRMAALRGLMRSYGPGMTEVFARYESAREIVETAQNGDELLREAERKADAAESELARAADRLDAARAIAGPRFAEAVTEQMGSLEMGSAQLEVSQERLPREQWTVSGPSRIELLYRPGSGLTARPLRRIASGGEISRVMLACKVVLGASDDTETLVFDEVDAGVGGATAIALADVLATLAKTHQVIVVTHLPQVAVRGERHYVVRKHELADEQGVPQTEIALLDDDERVVEIARMLSGDTDEASLAHARNLLGRGAFQKGATPSA